MKGKRIISIFLGIIIIVAFSVTMFLLWTDWDCIFWLTYLFMLLAIVGVSVNVGMLKHDDVHFASNLTLVTISAVYLVVCAVASVVGAKWLHMGGKGYFVLHIILFSSFLCIWIVTRSILPYINKQD